MDTFHINEDRSEIQRLFETVVSGGYCIGCGACAALKDSPITMQLNKYGQLSATTITTEPATAVLKVCPFSEEALNEDQISQGLYQDQARSQYDPLIGYHSATYAGYVREGSYRDSGSSGGMGTWIAGELLKEGLVDGVIHVHSRMPSTDDPRLFHYQISTTLEQVLQGAKSRYYPIELSEIITQIRQQPQRYAIVGIPCFIKSIRLLMLQDPEIGERIRFCIGLVCGHLKSLEFARMLAWQCGFEPEQIVAFDFRKKLPNFPANRYGIEVTGEKAGKLFVQTSPVQQLYGHDWGWGFFKYKACDYCDDVVAETADVTVGDAWLPSYVSDSQGTNILIVRHPILAHLIEQAQKEGRIQLEPISAAEVVLSQKAGFRHRREGLAYRLFLSERQGQWHPKKRVIPQEDHVDDLQKKRYQLRMEMAEQSHLLFQEALNEGRFSLFVEKMEQIVSQYRQLNTTPISQQSKLPQRLSQKVMRKIKSLIKLMFGNQ